MGTDRGLFARFQDTLPHGFRAAKRTKVRAPFLICVHLLQSAVKPTEFMSISQSTSKRRNRNSTPTCATSSPGIFARDQVPVLLDWAKKNFRPAQRDQHHCRHAEVPALCGRSLRDLQPEGLGARSSKEAVQYL